MTAELDLSLFQKDGVELENYQLLPKPMRNKFIIDLAFCVNSDYSKLKEIQSMESEQDVLWIIKQILSKHCSSTTNLKPCEREKQVMSLLQSTHRETQTRAFQYAAKNPSRAYSSIMKSIVNKHRDPFYMACLARVLSATSIQSIHDLLILLRSPNPLVLKSVLEGLEAQGSIYARRVFLSILTLPMADSSVIYQLCSSAIHRIPGEIRALCWAQAIAYQDRDFAIKANLKILGKDFRELEALNDHTHSVEKKTNISSKQESDFHQLQETEENEEKVNLNHIRQILSRTQDEEVIKRFIKLLEVNSETSEWTTLEPLLGHHNPEIRLAAGKALFYFKDKRVKSHFSKVLTDPEIPAWEKMKWAEAGFSLLTIMDEPLAIDFLTLLLKSGPDSVRCLNSCLGQWEYPGSTGMKLFLKSLEGNPIKPFHLPMIRSFLEKNLTLIKSLKATINLPQELLGTKDSYKAVETANSTNLTRSNLHGKSSRLLDNLQSKWTEFMEFSKDIQRHFSVAK